MSNPRATVGAVHWSSFRQVFSDSSSLPILTRYRSTGGHMNTHQVISTILDSAALSYGTSLLQLNPWGSESNNKVIAERNISFHIARSFTNCMACGVAFMELRFLRTSINGITLTPPKTCRLDVYCMSPEIAILLEVKTFFDRSEIDKGGKGILDDMDRVDSKYPNQQQQRHPKTIPQDTRGLVVVESWKQHNRQWWLQPGNPIDLHGFTPLQTAKLIAYKQAGWIFGSVFVGTFPVSLSKGRTRHDPCHWLYCYSPSPAPGLVAPALGPPQSKDLISR